MAPVGEAGPATGVGSGHTFSYARATEAVAAPAQRTLARIAPESRASGVSLRPVDGRAMAPFLAHLIATVQGVPQTRARRRADPNWAITTYGAVMKIPAAAGRTVRESR